MYPVYLRGLACLKTGQANEAETEFKKILSHKGIVQNFVIGSLAELQLARAQAMSLKNDAARKSYQSFFESWKEADPDVPILAEAKREYAQLK
jgi:gas vesicle protein